MNDEEDEEDLDPSGQSSSGHGKGVTQELSELSKTFTRQLWGVASFLAPPPETNANETDQREQFESTSDSDVSRNAGFGSEPQGLSNFPADSHHKRQEPSPNELTGRDHPLSEGDSPRDPDAVPNLARQHRLTGVGKDFAELKGSVATGLSKIMKVVREEIERDRLADVGASISDDDSNQYVDERENVSHAGELPGINSFLKPLFGGLLQKETGANLKDDASLLAEDKEPTAGLGHWQSGVKRAISFPSTLGGGIDGISKLASSLFPVSLESDEEDADGGGKVRKAAGITEEVLTFARNISMHPETWLDFPLFFDDEDDDDFEMSDAQKEHVSQVELASPRLAALRIELCPDCMSEGRFWKIYFVLLHSRLTKTDAVLLSTSQIVEARSLLLRELQKRELQVNANVPSESDLSNSSGTLQSQDVARASNSVSEKSSGMMIPSNIVSVQDATDVPSKRNDQTEDLPGSSENRFGSSSLIPDCGEEIQNKKILTSTVKFAALRYEEEEADADKWLNEEPSSHTGFGSGLGNDDDVSFSDLEEDDDSVATKVVESSDSKRSYGWVQLNKNQSSQEIEGGLGLSDKIKPKGVGLGKNVTSQAAGSQTLDQWSKKTEKAESSDWLTVEEDDVGSPEFS